MRGTQKLRNRANSSERVVSNGKSEQVLRNTIRWWSRSGSSARICSSMVGLGMIRSVLSRMRQRETAGNRGCQIGYMMPNKNETRVAVFLGGRSPEHDVSII